MKDQSSCRLMGVKPQAYLVFTRVDWLSFGMLKVGLCLPDIGAGRLFSHACMQWVHSSKPTGIVANCLLIVLPV